MQNDLFLPSFCPEWATNTGREGIFIPELGKVLIAQELYPDLPWAEANRQHTLPTYRELCFIYAWKAEINELLIGHGYPALPEDRLWTNEEDEENGGHLTVNFINGCRGHFSCTHFPGFSLVD